MDLQTFQSSLRTNTPPAGLNPCLEALWFDGRENWDEAHRIAQDIDDPNGAWIHAYLHRKEGDSGNARYWYNLAGRNMPSVTLEKEWLELVEYFLNAPPP